MIEFFKSLFTIDGFPPRRLCGDGWLEDPALMWWHVGVDVLIFLGYMVIAVVAALWRLQQSTKFERRNVTWWFFVAFFILCGGTHGIKIVMFWLPIYRFEGYVWGPLQLISVVCAVWLLLFSERKRWRDPVQLENDHAQLHAIVDLTPQAMYCVNRLGECTVINTKALAVLGYSDKDDLLGKNMHLAIHHHKTDGEDYEQSHCEIFRSMQSNIETSQPHDIFWTRAGEQIPVSWIATPIIVRGESVGSRIAFVETGDTQVIGMRQASRALVTHVQGSLSQRIRKQ
jgi:PAS domain S-box-containing protein